MFEHSSLTTYSDAARQFSQCIRHIEKIIHILRGYNDMVIFILKKGSCYTVVALSNEDK